LARPILLVVAGSLTGALHTLADEPTSHNPAADRLTAPTLIAANTRVIAEGQTPVSLGTPLAIHRDKWLEFEREFGIHRPSSSGFLRWVQKVKYSLDTATFTAEEQIKRLEFSYNIGTPGPARGGAQSDYALPLFGRFGQARLQSHLTTHDADTGSPYFGLKLTIPFGPGGEPRLKVKLTPAEKREKSDRRRALRFAVESDSDQWPRRASAE